ncbi:insulin-like growth factor-binding protein 1a isoform X2 [Chanos chanos]|uniref:Insulin-like growth factor-binding protein 1 n=1 Tax=Chanos chanos TaxID=29144 RepID=A0A6J2V999_CHACN|nr:insulin-like growth factor-binding protein 1 isoform X2 [Chanos chanos]
MSGLPLKFFWVAALSSLLFALELRASPVVAQEPIRCAPCSPERLAECPAVDPQCEEVLREPGCGCCLACALKKGDLCGIHTAPCGSGLRCLPKPGEARPLHALTRGQAVCTEISGQSQTTQTPEQGDHELESRNGATASEEFGSPLFLPGHGKPLDPRVVAGAQESMKAKVNAIRRKFIEQGPCHVELHRALEKIAKSQQKLGDKLTRFYLPNCDKKGLYKAKQCESFLDGQRGKCWCVSAWNGKKIMDLNDLPADADCPQEANH